MEILNHGIPFWAVLAYLVYMAAVQALPRPDETSGKGYVFLYGFLHLLAVNLKLAFDPKKTLPIVEAVTTPEPAHPWQYPPPPKG